MQKRIIALDLGLKRIGLACAYGDVLVPLQPILRKNRHQAADAVKDVLIKQEAQLLVVGMLVDSQNTQESQRRMEHFIGLLGLDIPVVYVDESYSSKEAMQRSQGILRERKRQGYLDSLAALVILERYCDSMKSEVKEC